MKRAPAIDWNIFYILNAIINERKKGLSSTCLEKVAELVIASETIFFFCVFNIDDSKKKVDTGFDKTFKKTNKRTNKKKICVIYNHHYQFEKQMLVIVRH